MKRARSDLPERICEATDLSPVTNSVLSCQLFEFEGDFYAEVTAFFCYWWDILPRHQARMTDHYRKQFKLSNDFQSVNHTVVYDRNKLDANGNARKRKQVIQRNGKYNHVCVYDFIILICVSACISCCENIYRYVFTYVCDKRIFGK
jgi:hypothetical protein